MQHGRWGMQLPKDTRIAPQAGGRRPNPPVGGGGRRGTKRQPGQVGR